MDVWSYAHQILDMQIISSYNICMWSDQNSLLTFTQKGALCPYVGKTPIPLGKTATSECVTNRSDQI